MNYGNGRGPLKRKSIPIEHIKKVQTLCYDMDDEIRWLVAILSDTGMRLSEAVGLIKSDIQLNDKVSFIGLKPHSWRKLKTAGSQRDLPLVGAALWAVKRAKQSSKTEFLFPKYCTEHLCKSDHASNTLNKWLRQIIGDGFVVHSFRHSFRDRLREVHCPSDIVDELGGWKTHGIGVNYGLGHSMDKKFEFISKIKIVL
jgi:integrase